MPKRMRLNDKTVREPLPVKGRDSQIFDTDVRGFAVCIYRSGSRAFTLDYRYAGRQRRMLIHSICPNPPLSNLVKVGRRAIRGT